VTTGILVFIFSWNEFMFALTFMNLESAKTITVGIATLSGAFTYEVPWGLLAAGVVASSIPLIVLAVIFQRKIVAASQRVPCNRRVPAVQMLSGMARRQSSKRLAPVIRTALRASQRSTWRPCKSRHDNDSADR
jgi:hypothetical protein